MQVKVLNPKYTVEFAQAIHQGKVKGNSTIINEQNNTVEVMVKNNRQLVGKYLFLKQNDKAILTKQHTIQRLYYPLEFCIYVLTSHFKGSKIKYILSHSDTAQATLS